MKLIFFDADEKWETPIFDVYSSDSKTKKTDSICVTAGMDTFREIRTEEGSAIVIEEEHIISKYNIMNISVKGVRFHGRVPILAMQEQKAIINSNIGIVEQAVIAYNLSHTYSRKGLVDSILLTWKGTADIDFAHNFHVHVTTSRCYRRKKPKC